MTIRPQYPLDDRTWLCGECHQPLNDLPDASIDQYDEVDGEQCYDGTAHEYICPHCGALNRLWSGEEIPTPPPAVE